MDKIDKIAKRIAERISRGEKVRAADVEKVFSKHGLEYLLPVFKARLERHLAFKEGLDEVLVETAFDDKNGEIVLERVFGAGKKAVSGAERKVNKNLLAGAKVLYKGYRFDASVEGQINNFQKTLKD